MPVTEEQLEDVAKYSEVLETGSDFLEEEVRKACEEIIPFPERVEPTECVVPENIHTPTTEGISHKVPPPPRDFHFLTTKIPPPPPLRNFHYHFVHPPYPLDKIV